MQGEHHSLFENKKSAVRPSKRPGIHYRAQHIVVRWCPIKRLDFETAFLWNWNYIQTWWQQADTLTELAERVEVSKVEKRTHELVDTIRTATVVKASDYLGQLKSNSLDQE